MKTKKIELIEKMAAAIEMQERCFSLTTKQRAAILYMEQTEREIKTAGYGIREMRQMLDTQSSL